MNHIGILFACIVLIQTGSLGGSCVSFIGPGMVYLGVNGDAFQELCRKMVENWNHQHNDKKEADGPSQSNQPVEMELPVVGDADQRIPNGTPTAEPTGPVDLPLAGERRVIAATDGVGSFSKPFWWYLGGFPIWWAIASTGSNGMRERLSSAAEGHGDATAEGHIDIENEKYLPTKGGYCMAVFFIIFGIVAAVAGVVSNLVLQFAPLA